MDTTVSRVVGAVCGLMFGIVAVQAMLPDGEPPMPPPPAPTASCVGQPIEVDYRYSGWLEPHECAVQCDDDKPRYILYTDGRATQCQTPPGCNDEGEDKGIFCTPPNASPGA